MLIKSSTVGLWGTVAISDLNHWQPGNKYPVQLSPVNVHSAVPMFLENNSDPAIAG